MRSLGRIAELLARTAASCAVVYLACLLAGGALLRALTALARGVLRLVDRPVVLTSLSPVGERVVITSFLSGIERPLATWDAVNLPIFLVATLGLALAAPATSARRRVEAVLLAAAVSVVTMLATVVVQIQVTAANAAGTELGLRLYDARADSFLAVANQGIGVAMLLAPAAIFAFAYVRFREDRRAAARAPLATASADSRRAAGPAVLLRLAAMGGGVILVVLALVAVGSAPVDPRPGLVRVVELNPAAPQAHVGLASYDALARLQRRRTPATSPPVVSN